MSGMINCKSCNQEISVEAKSCPKCGAPVKKKAGCLMQIGYAFLGLFGFMIVMAVISQKGDKQENSKSTTEEIQPKKTQPVVGNGDNNQVAVNKKIGDEVIFEDSKWTVISAENIGSTLKSPLLENKQTEGKFVKVKYTVTNISKDEETLMEKPKLLSADGAKYQQDEEALAYLGDGEKQMMLDPLPSRIKKTFTAIYEVPKDATKLRFQTRSLEAFGTKYVEVELGF